jgi:hypothetical protein
MLGTNIGKHSKKQTFFSEEMRCGILIANNRSSPFSPVFFQTFMMVYVSIVNQVTKTGSGRNVAIVLKKGRFLAPGCETEKALYERHGVSFGVEGPNGMSSDVRGCETRHFLRHLSIQCAILPRQARDKHRENSKKSGVFRRLVDYYWHVGDVFGRT